MNIVGLTGRITRELKLKKTENEKQFLFFTIAVNVTSDETAFVQCVVWNKLAENIAKHLKKGSLLSISGRLVTRNATYDGKSYNVTEVLVQSATFMDLRKDKEPIEPQEPKKTIEPKDNFRYKTEKKEKYKDLSKMEDEREREAELIEDDVDDEAIVWDN